MRRISLLMPARKEHLLSKINIENTLQQLSQVFSISNSTPPKTPTKPDFHLITRILSRVSKRTSSSQRAVWKMANKKETPGKGGSYGVEEMVDGLIFSKKSGCNLMQNCDLPPPMKIFVGQDETIVAPMNNVYSKLAGQKDEDVGIEMAYAKCSEHEKLELFKALRLSQTRAREAERKVAVLSKEKDDLSNFLLQQSMQLFAYKQWVRMMEFQLCKLTKHQEKQEPHYCAPSRAEKVPAEEDAHKGAKGMTWLVAVAICVGIAGVGFLSFFS